LNHDTSIGFYGIVPCVASTLSVYQLSSSALLPVTV